MGACDKAWEFTRVGKRNDLVIEASRQRTRSTAAPGGILAESSHRIGELRPFVSENINQVLQQATVGRGLLQRLLARADGLVLDED